MAKQDWTIEIDLGEATIGDLELMDEVERGERRVTEALDFFEKVVKVQGRETVRDLPLPALFQIQVAITQEMENLRNPESPEGN